MGSSYHATLIQRDENKRELLSLFTKAYSSVIRLLEAQTHPSSVTLF